MTIQLLASDHPAFPPGWRACLTFERGRLTRIGCHSVGDIRRRDDLVVITTIQCYTFVCCAADYLALLGMAPAQIAAWEYTDKARRPHYYASCWSVS